MESGSSLLCSLVPGPGPCSEPDESFSCHPVVFFNIIFNIILSVSRFSLQAVLPLSDQKPVCTCHFLQAFTCLTNLIFLDLTILLIYGWFRWMEHVISISTKDGQGNFKNNLDCRTKVGRTRYKWL